MHVTDHSDIINLTSGRGRGVTLVERDDEIDLDELVQLEEDVSPATGGGCGGLC